MFYFPFLHSFRSLVLPLCTAFIRFFYCISFIPHYRLPFRAFHPLYLTPLPLLSVSFKPFRSLILSFSTSFSFLLWLMSFLHSTLATPFSCFSSFLSGSFDTPLSLSSPFSFFSSVFHLFLLSSLGHVLPSLHTADSLFLLLFVSFYLFHLVPHPHSFTLHTPNTLPPFLLCFYVHPFTLQPSNTLLPFPVCSLCPSLHLTTS